MGCKAASSSRKDAIAGVARLLLQLGGRTLGSKPEPGIVSGSMAVKAAQQWEAQLATQSTQLGDYIREKQMVMRRLRLGVPKGGPQGGGVKSPGGGRQGGTAAGRMTALACAQGLLSGAGAGEDVLLRLSQLVMQPSVFAA